MHNLNKLLPYEVSPELYQQVLDRDGNCCRECGSRNNIQCHHILNRGATGKSDICNLVMLCEPCHRKAERGRGKWSKRTYEELIHIGPCEAFIHSHDFSQIICKIHEKPVISGFTT